MTWLNVLRTREDLLWRCYGLGTFMIVPVIKLCVVDGRMTVSPVDIKQSKTPTSQTLPKRDECFNAKAHVDLHLKCTPDFQMRFYEYYEFVHLNPISADAATLRDGHHLLPESLRESVERDEEDCSFFTQSQKSEDRRSNNTSLVQAKRRRV